MSICPRCDRPVPSQAIACPHCHFLLKAYGHPGMPLYQASDQGYLCDRCLYDQDDSCTYPQRTQAKSCILFHDFNQPVTPGKIQYSSHLLSLRGIQDWSYRNRAWLIIASLIAFSLFLTLSR